MITNDCKCGHPMANMLVAHSWFMSSLFMLKGPHLRTIIWWLWTQSQVITHIMAISFLSAKDWSKLWTAEGLWGRRWACHAALLALELVWGLDAWTGFGYLLIVRVETLQSLQMWIKASVLLILLSFRIAYFGTPYIGFSVGWSPKYLNWYTHIFPSWPNIISLKRTLQQTICKQSGFIMA